MKKWFVLFFIFMQLALKSSGQVVTQTYIDPCDLKTYVVSIPIVPNSGVTVIIRNKSKVFTYSQFISGEVDSWIKSIFSTPCPANIVVQQTVTATVAQAASQAASSAASSAAASASSTASSTASSAASTTSSPPPATSSSSSSTSQSSFGGSSSTSESKSETSSSSTESSSESKSESSSESKSESKSEEKKSDEKKSDEKKDEKKDDKKKDEKKKVQVANPMLLASDLTSAQGPDFKYNVIFSLGISKSSAVGNETFSANALIWSSLNQFALSGGYTKMDFEMGKLNAIHSYSMTTAYLSGNWMTMGGYTYIKPHPKHGTYGYNLGIISLFLKNEELVGEGKFVRIKEVFDVSLTTSAVAFWTKPYQYSQKITISPQVFVMNSPILWNSKTGETTSGRNLGFLLGSSFDYKITKRFGFSLNYKLSASTQKNTPILSNFLIGSRVML